MDRKSLLQASKPILFSTQMVKAILEGRKTVTRRLVKFLDGKNPNWTGYIKDGLTLYNGTNEPCNKKPPYAAGDYLYVRETWSDDRQFTHDDTPGQYFYRANFPIDGWSDEKEFKWRPSIHMPKEAARIFLKVTDVRVERLQDMVKEDFEKEGVIDICNGCGTPRDFCDCCGGLEEEFIELWDSTIKTVDLDKYGWEANPWVWVIEFERVEV